MRIYDWSLPMCDKCFERGHERKDCTWTTEELHLISRMAAFVGARLNYVVPPCGPRRTANRLVSTIKVDQHKEKFFWARVYCNFADRELVEQKWNDEKREGELSWEFIDSCFRNDAWHYRTVYLDMLAITPPKFHPRIRGQADYSELLFDDVSEMLKYLDTLAAPDPERPNADDLVNYRGRYQVTTNEELRTKLTKFYERPSFREWIGDA